MAVMSAEQPHRARAGRSSIRFRMEQPIPSYLLALAVGDLAFRLGRPAHRRLRRARGGREGRREFADSEKMVATAESLFGPYRWGRYDLLVLPPSFPYGGMENPRLTFATPTILAGDRSLVSLVAHELAHSWSGNLVTNATWSDFWLNEGFTNYFESRIMEALYGREFSEMQAALQLASLKKTIAEMGPTNPDTRLRLDARRPRPGRRRERHRLREGLLLRPPARGAGRARALRRLPARVLRPLRLPGDGHRDRSSPI
jgi:aminopeptidase N